MTLNQEQIDQFHRHGYVKVGKVLQDDEIEQLREQYDLEFEKARDNNAYRNLATNDGGSADEKEAAPQQMLQIMQMCERNIHFRQLLFNQRILDMAEDLIGPNIQLFHDQALFKPAGHGGAVFWHQDNAYWKCNPANLISCWLTLDDVDVHNGAMQVIPGSHLTPIRHESSQDTNALLDLKDVDPSQATVNDLPAGGCMFHHCQTLHYTAPNETENQRRAFAIHMMPPGTRRADNENDSIHMPVSFKQPLLRAG
jgi:ectoine hydroxylase-related dioxygenase (phytanoyl-CoA dioxygenase family)